MTPKEKAKELVEKFRYDVKREYPWMDELYDFEAKQCATILVNEIIEAVLSNDWSDPLMPFWESVKEEIEKL